MKRIEITEDIIRQYRKQARDLFNKGVENKLKDWASSACTTKTSSISIPSPLELVRCKVKPIIKITDTAHRKMQALVAECDKEIAWHGLVKKTKNVYKIYDILVFPQEVTGTQAYSLDEEYGPWIGSITNEHYNNLRMHGHSHVNMEVSPSLTDTNYQRDVVTQIDNFYIFTIQNKRGNAEWWVYDKVQNIMFENADISIELQDPIRDWAIEEMAEKVKKYQPVIKPVQQTVHYAENDPGYYQQFMQGVAQQVKQVKQDNIKTQNEAKIKKFTYAKPTASDSYDEYLRQSKPWLYK